MRPRSAPDARLPAKRRTLALLVWVALATACGEEQPEPEPVVPSPAALVDSSGTFRARVYQRNLVFVAPRTDSTVVVPWVNAARTEPGGVQRSARAWLGRNGDWEPFLDESWQSAAIPDPWMLIPRGPMRLVMGLENALQTLVFEGGARNLAIELQDQLVEWASPQGDQFRLLEGMLELQDVELAGYVLDMARSRPAEREPGDWALLVSGDSLEVVLHAATSNDAPVPMDGWARLNFRSIPFGPLTVRWSETRSFEPARREVPGRFVLSGGEASFRLDVESAELTALEGEGPQLPVFALFTVRGVASIEGAEYPVFGILNHVQR